MLIIYPLINNNNNFQQGVVLLANIMEERGMKINIIKSKIMKIGEGEKIEIQWKHEELEQIDIITYLGAIISNKNIMDVTKAYNIYYTFAIVRNTNKCEN